MGISEGWGVHKWLSGREIPRGWRIKTKEPSVGEGRGWIFSGTTHFQSVQMSWSIPGWLSPNVDWVSVEMSIKCKLTVAWGLIGMLIICRLRCWLLINTWPQILPLLHMIFHAYSCVKYLVLYTTADHGWKISITEFVLHYYCRAIPHEWLKYAVKVEVCRKINSAPSWQPCIFGGSQSKCFFFHSKQQARSIFFNLLYQTWKI